MLFQIEAVDSGKECPSILRWALFTDEARLPQKKFYITIKCWAYRRVGVVGQLHKNKEHLSFFCRNKEKRAKFRWYRVSPLFIFFSVPTLKASWRSERFFAMQKSAPCATPGEMNYQWRLWLMNRAAAIKAATIVYVKDVEIDPSHPSMTYNLAQSSGIFLFFCFVFFLSPIPHIMEMELSASVFFSYLSADVSPDGPTNRKWETPTIHQTAKGGSGDPVPSVSNGLLRTIAVMCSCTLARVREERFSHFVTKGEEKGFIRITLGWQIDI